MSSNNDVINACALWARKESRLKVPESNLLLLGLSCIGLRYLKGQVRSKIKLSSKSVKNAKQRAITDLNAPNGSRDIAF